MLPAEHWSKWSRCECGGFFLVLKLGNMVLEA